MNQWFRLLHSFDHFLTFSLSFLAFWSNSFSNKILIRCFGIHLLAISQMSLNRLWSLIFIFWLIRDDLRLAMSYWLRLIKWKTIANVHVLNWFVWKEIMIYQRVLALIHSPRIFAKYDLKELLSVLDVFVFHNKANEFVDDLSLMWISSSITWISISSPRFNSSRTWNSRSIISWSLKRIVWKLWRWRSTCSMFSRFSFFLLLVLIQRVASISNKRLILTYELFRQLMSWGKSWRTDRNLQIHELPNNGILLLIVNPFHRLDHL